MTPRPPSVLVVGSVNQDVTVRTPRFPAPGETLAGRDVIHGLGGKGANQAVASARTGLPTKLLARVGDDDAGRRLTTSLRELGVDVTLVRSSSRPTGTALVMVDDAGENSIIVVAGANAETSPEDVQGAREAIARAGVVVVQGEVPPETIRAVLDVAAGTSTRVVVNLAPFVALPEGTLAKAAALVVNETETGQLLGGAAPASVAAALDAARALARDIPLVVVTLGANGAVYAEATGATAHVPVTAAARVVDTTGAGDAFVGVLAAALACGAASSAAVADAVRAASRAVENLGAAPSYPAFELQSHVDRGSS